MSITDRLNRVFDIPVETEPSKSTMPTNPDEIKQQRLSAQKMDDIQLARDTIVNLINKSTDLLDDVINLAKESESPRAIEVTSSLIKTTADLSKDLIEIHSKESKNSSPKEQPGEQNNTQNNYYVGTTADLQKMIKEQSGGSE